jgi:hypothetical protein
MRQTNLYPFATVDGGYIPSDVLRPVSIVSVGITSSGSSSAIAIPEDVDAMAICAKVDTIIQFGQNGTITATALSNEVLKNQAAFVPANTVAIFSPQSGMTHFAARALANSGIIIVEFLESWNALSTATKYVRR